MEIKIDSRLIGQKDSIKYQGLRIDSNLKWKSHIQHIAKNIKRCIYILSKIRYCVTQQVPNIQLYYTIIFLFLTYSLITWGAHTKSPSSP